MCFFFSSDFCIRSRWYKITTPIMTWKKMKKKERERKPTVNKLAIHIFARSALSGIVHYAGYAHTHHHILSFKYNLFSRFIIVVLLMLQLYCCCFVSVLFFSLSLSKKNHDMRSETPFSGTLSISIYVLLLLSYFVIAYTNKIILKIDLLLLFAVHKSTFSLKKKQKWINK